MHSHDWNILISILDRDNITIKVASSTEESGDDGDGDMKIGDSYMGELNIFLANLKKSTD